MVSFGHVDINPEAPAVLSGLDIELERYIAELLASSDVECGLTSEPARVKPS